MTARIDRETLARHLMSHDRDDERLVGYFRVDENASDALTPRLALVSGLVFDELGELSGRDASALELVELWLQRAAHKRRERFESVLAKGFEGRKIVIEGDSWFHHPGELTDIFDHLSRRDEFALYALDANAGWQSSMLHQRRFATAVQRHSADVLILGGGLSDVLGRRQLASMLQLNDKAGPQASYASDRLEQWSTELDACYREMFSQLLEAQPDLTIVLHGYDYMIPAHGAWLGAPLGALGLNDRGAQREFIAEIIDRLNTMLRDLAAEPGLRHNVHHVDLRGSVREWHDELHPNSEGFAAITERLVRCIDRVHTDAARGDSPPSQRDAEASM